jgi:hypothetical protein
LHGRVRRLEEGWGGEWCDRRNSRRFVIGKGQRHRADEGGGRQVRHEQTRRGYNVMEGTTLCVTGHHNEQSRNVSGGKSCESSRLGAMLGVRCARTSRCCVSTAPSCCTSNGTAPFQYAQAASWVRDSKTRGGAAGGRCGGACMTGMRGPGRRWRSRGPPGSMWVDQRVQGRGGRPRGSARGVKGGGAGASRTHREVLCVAVGAGALVAEHDALLLLRAAAWVTG